MWHTQWSCTVTQSSPSWGAFCFALKTRTWRTATSRSSRGGRYALRRPISRGTSTSTTPTTSRVDVEPSTPSNRWFPPSAVNLGIVRWNYDMPRPAYGSGISMVKPSSESFCSGAAAIASLPIRPLPLAVWLRWQVGSAVLLVFSSNHIFKILSQYQLCRNRHWARMNNLYLLTVFEVETWDRQTETDRQTDRSITDWSFNRHVSAIVSNT